MCCGPDQVPRSALAANSPHMQSTLCFVACLLLKPSIRQHTVDTVCPKTCVCTGNFSLLCSTLCHSTPQLAATMELSGRPDPALAGALVTEPAYDQVTGRPSTTALAEPELCRSAGAQVEACGAPDPEPPAKRKRGRPPGRGKKSQASSRFCESVGGQCSAAIERRTQAPCSSCFACKGSRGPILCGSHQKC